MKSSEKNKNQMYVYLGIKEFKESPDEITRMIGVRPTSVNRKGDFIGKTSKRYRNNGWKLKVSSATSFDLERLLKKLFLKFKDKKKLMNAISKGSGQIVCVVHYADSLPTIEISPATLKKITDLNCGFWLDYYFTLNEIR
jgi:hypothetical protein